MLYPETVSILSRAYPLVITSYSIHYTKLYEGVQDGECVKCDLLIKSADAVKAVQSGKCELSCGYTALYDSTPGVTEDGTPYEFIQRDIKINHVAIVSRGRSSYNFV